MQDIAIEMSESIACLSVTVCVHEACEKTTELLAMPFWEQMRVSPSTY